MFKSFQIKKHKNKQKEDPVGLKWDNLCFKNTNDYLWLKLTSDKKQ